MPFRPAVHTAIKIDSRPYRVCQHPAAPGMAYGQAGRRATVFQLSDLEGRLYALKVFNPAFRTPETERSAAVLGKLATLPGLQACARLPLTPARHADTLQVHPDLAYAALMPWVEGETWQELVMSGRPLKRRLSRRLALRLLEILTGLERRGLAHCDLSGPNVLIALDARPEPVALVDLEEMFGSGLAQPSRLPAGSAGYSHREASAGLWRFDADHFAGAVLLVEMLCWCDERIRRVACGEQYFDPGEMQQNCERYRLLARVLRELWGQAAAEAWARAWFSQSLGECPTFAEWSERLALEAGAAEAADPPAATPAGPSRPAAAPPVVGPSPAAAARRVPGAGGAVAAGHELAAPTQRSPSGRPVWRWAAAATLIVVLLLGGLLGAKLVFPAAGQPTPAEASAQGLETGQQALAATQSAAVRQQALGQCAAQISEPLAAGWPILACDRFLDNAANWPSGDYADAFISGGKQLIGGGAYQLSGTALQGVTWIHKSGSDPVKDFLLTAEARRMQGPEETACYGLVFRYDEKSHSYYLFEVCDDRQYKVDYGSDGHIETLVDWTPADAVSPGAANWLAVLGEADRFRLFINQSEVTGFSDARLVRGFAGVFSAAAPGDTFAVQFQNFLLRGR